MSDLKWESPPMRGSKVQDWRRIIDELKERPGAWAVVYEQQEHESKSDARNRRHSFTRFGNQVGVLVEAISRTVDDRIRIYARVQK